MKNKLKIVVSAVNFFEGGPLSVLTDCLKYLNNSPYKDQFEICALVHKRDLFHLNEYNNITFIEFPRSRTSYFCRLYYEYYYFKSFAEKQNVFFWLSLHDITPRLDNIQQAVYCHNPSPFRKLKFKNARKNPTEFVFNLFYKYLYKINIQKNKFVIVQQQWIREEFSSMFALDKSKIIVSTPDINTFVPLRSDVNFTEEGSRIERTFIYPTLARSFKNIEVLGDAVRYLNSIGHYEFKIFVTIDGTENTYAQGVVDKYKDLSQIVFIGKIERSKVYDYYSKVDGLIFPSTLETWGMPITEFKRFKKPIIVADLPYAKETVNNYDKAIFFDPDDFRCLAHILIKFIKDKDLKYNTTDEVVYEKPYASDWETLFKLLLN